MFSLVHLSDPHLGPLPDVRWRELASKRVLGYVNWHRNRARALGPESLRRLVDDIRAGEPDHIAVTGDLVNIGLPAEILAARDWLTVLGEPDDVSIVPGNHDAYHPGAIPHFAREWQPFMSADGDSGPATFPYVRRRGPVGIVGISTAIATAPLMATGRIERDQAAVLARHLETLKEEGRFRVVLIHHPPVRGSTKWHRRLIGAEHFRAAIAEAGAELVLHGHNHRVSVATVPGPERPVPVIGAASASLPGPGTDTQGSYLLYRITEKDGAFACDMTLRGPATPDGPITTLSELKLLG